jgi:hypothetical protein
MFRTLEPFVDGWSHSQSTRRSHYDWLNSYVAFHSSPGPVLTH